MNCKFCKADCALRGEENPKECAGFIAMTNADVIRATTDEGLAAFMYEVDSRKGVTSFEGWVDWTKQPYKED